MDLKTPFLVVLINLLLTQFVYAQIGEPYQISGEMVTFGDVQKWAISPDGEYVIYLADQRVDGVDELFSAPITGGPVTRLSLDLGTGEEIDDFQISPDSASVVYRLRGDSFINKIFSVAISGGESTLLNQNSESLNRVSNFAISPDSARVIYRDSTTESIDLFSVPISGGVAIRLNPDPVDGGGVSFLYSISSDSQRVIYIADQRVNNQVELFSVPITGGAATLLNNPVFSGSDVNFFRLSPDASRVIYSVQESSSGPLSLFSVPIAGGSSIRLDSDSSAGDIGVVTNFQISSDSQKVAFVDGLGRALYSVPIAGGTPLRLARITRPNTILDLRMIGRSSARLVYSVRTSSPQEEQIFSVPLEGGSPVRLDTNLEGNVSAREPRLSPDGSTIVYTAQTRNEPGIIQVFSVPLAGGDATLISANANGPIITPDSLNVIYRNATSPAQLFIAPITGGNSIRINADLPFMGSVFNFDLSFDGAYLVYLAEQDVFGEMELFARQLQERPESSDGEFCVPIKTANQNLALICL